MRSKWIVLFCSLLLTTALWGCGSDSGSGGSDVGGEPTGPNEVGNSACQQCHSGAHSDASAVNRTEATVADQTGIDLLVEHLAADETIYSVLHDCEDCHGGGLFHANGPQGNPMPIRQPRAADCAVCHDQVDGIFAWDSHVVPVAGEDQTACSSCHAPLTLDEAVRLEALNCMGCHDTTAVDPIVTAEASPISAKVAASMHSGGSTRTSANCQRCHTIDGFLNLIDLGINPSANANYTSPITARELAPTCAACHEPHTGDMRTVPGWDPNMNGVADQFDLCTACHNLYDNNGDLVTTYYHQTTWYRNIQSTHYDNPATGYGLAENAIEGYVVRDNGENPCFDCHGHELRTNTRRHTEAPQADPTYGPTIHTDWANSRHGGVLLETKLAAAVDNPVTASRTLDPVNYALQNAAQFDAVMTAGREDKVGYGWSWTHYDWDAMAGGFSGTGRQDCQRCHTSTGTSNYAQDPSTYDPANNDFSHLANWPSGATSSSPQNEMLYCWGCHENPGTGLLYDVGGIVEDYAGEGVIVTYPDIDHSNTCMVCHLGREIGENVKNVANFTDTGFVNSHYLAAGASVFGVSGYEYPGLNYANPAIYAHDGIGTAFEANIYPNNADLAATDNDMGPCVGCHMTAVDGSHNFLPFELTEDGSAFEYLTPVCAECHTVGSVYEITPALIEEEEAGYDAAIAALNGALQGGGIYYLSSYPYFFADENGDGIVPTPGYTFDHDGDAGTDPIAEDNRANGITDWIMDADNDYPVGQDLPEAGAFNMGAAFNMNLAAHDPGGFAHNRFYYKRLIWDAIDWLDDYTLNDSVPTAIANLQTAGRIDATQAGHAAAYLGDSRPGAGPDRAAIPGLDATTNF